MSSLARVTRIRPAHGVTTVEAVQGTLALDLTPVLDPPVPNSRPGRPGCDVVTVPHALRVELEKWVDRYSEATVTIFIGFVFTAPS